MSGGSGNVIVGFKYFFGIHMGICRGEVDEMVQIQVGDRTAWAGSIATSGAINIEAPELFGGNDGEGGIIGPAKVMFGESTQVAPAELVAMNGEALPGYRRMFTFFFDGLISAMNPYPKAWKFRVRRSQKGWDGATWHPELATIGLTRPTTPGDSSSTGSIVDTVTGTVFAPNWQTYVIASGTITLDPAFDQERFGVYVPSGAEVTSIIQIFIKRGTGEYYTEIYLAAGTEYTWAPGSNVVTIIGYSDDELIGASYTYQATYTSGGSGMSTAAIQAMNPAHIVYECLTNREWGRGLDRADLDDAAFLASANTLFQEKFGLCLKWSRTDTIESFVQSVLDHIGGVLYSDRSTALLKLDLIRGGYDVATLPLFDSESGLLDIKQAAVPTPRGLINEVQITYHDPVTDKDAFVKAQNLAMKQASGGASIVLKKEYPGVPLASLAGRLAQRDLRANGIGLRRFELTFDRRGAGIVPGAVIRIRDLARNIKDVVVRIGTFEEAQNGDIRVSGVQDAFGFPAATFTGYEPNAWVPPVRRACIGRQKVFEVPYITLYRRMSTADFGTLTETDAYLGTVMEMGQPLNASYNVAVKDGAVDHGTEDPADGSYYCGYVP